MRFKEKTTIAVSVMMLLLVPTMGFGEATLIFPQIADGGGYRTSFLITNRAQIRTTATIRFRASTGAPLAVTIGGRTSDFHSVEIEGDGSAKVQTAGLSSNISVGWAQVDSSPPTDLGGHAVFQLFRGGGLYSEASVPASTPTGSAAFFADEEGGFNTGVAIANPGEATAAGTLTLRDRSGAIVRTSSVDLPAGQHQAKFLFQLLGPVSSGRAEIELREGSVSVIALRLHSSSVFSAISVMVPSIRVVSGTCGAIQHAINALPSGGGQVVIHSGTYTCTTPIVIDRDDVDLRGQGPSTVLRLADSANAPVLVLGQTNAVPSATRRRIRVSDLLVDGNRSNQSFECLMGPCTPTNPLRNNGLSLRRVEDVLIEHVIVKSARSGGLVSELGSRRVTVRDFTSSDNQFDGLAAYETENSVFTGLHLLDNLSAGLSFDIRFNNNMVSNAVIAGNRKVGIFMRDSRDNVFTTLQIRNSGEHGIFLAQVDSDSTKPASGNTFTGLAISDSAGAGIRINDGSCVNNLVCNSQFIRNASGSISEVVSGLVGLCGIVRR